MEVRRVVGWLGHFTLGVTSIAVLGGDLGPKAAMGSLAIVMACFWIFEVAPLGITALLPIFFFPLLGIAPAKFAIQSYMSQVIMLFLAGFLFARAIQNWGLHKRVAIAILMVFAGSGRYLVAGFFVASAFLSMWISNTATAVMMISLASSVLLKLGDEGEHTLDIDLREKLEKCVLLAVCYGCSIGGMTSLVGTPPNLTFQRTLQNNFPEFSQFGFGSWFMIGIPVGLVLGVISLGILYFFYLRVNPVLPSREFFKKQWRELGPWSRPEKIVAFYFFVLSGLWTFRKPISVGDFRIPGWSEWHPHFLDFSDASIGIMVCLILFFTPVGRGDSKRLLELEALKKVPWETLLLFGGGFALARGMQASGLSALFGEVLGGFSDWGPGPMTLLFNFCMVFFTEVSSNTASTEMVLPILTELSKKLGVSPLTLMIPVTMSASCAFMLPAATPPNALVFSTGKLKVKEMASIGLWLNFVAIGLITLASLFLVPLIF